MPTLLVKNAKGDHQVSLDGRTTIGRHPENDICIAETEVSKFHGVILETGNGFVYKDLNSSNGSYVNELRVKEHELKVGDIIRIGQTLLHYQDEQVFDDLSSLVNFKHFDPQKTQYQERIDLVAVERFLPENEVVDVSMLRNDYEKLRLGQELLQSMGSERNIRILMDTISKHLLRMFVADRCVILLLNKAGNFEVSAVQSLEKLEGPITVSRTILKEAQTSKSAVLLSDAANEGELAQSSSLEMMGVQSVMCSPIINENKVIGAIQIDLRKGQGSFTKKDLQLLGGIVSYVAMAVANVGLTKKIEQESKTQAQFERLLSPSIVKQLVAGKLKIEKTGKLRHVTIMFVDIRGFTSMSQKASPAAVVNMLNQYFERVVDIVFKHGGTVDKYIGDEVMVLFGAPLPMEHQEDAALACALEIQEMLGVWNMERKKNKHIALTVGIGINSGEVVAGSIGSSRTMQYTCVGNTVNVASRLTNLAKPGQVVVSNTTMLQVKSKTAREALPPADIKGIEGKVQAYIVKAIQATKQADTSDI